MRLRASGIFNTVIIIPPQIIFFKSYVTPSYKYSLYTDSDWCKPRRDIQLFFTSMCVHICIFDTLQSPLSRLGSAPTWNSSWYCYKWMICYVSRVWLTAIRTAFPHTKHAAHWPVCGALWRSTRKHSRFIYSNQTQRALRGI